jgi:hypothetical protein
MSPVWFCAEGPLAFGELMLPVDGLVMPDDGVMPGVVVAGAAVDGFIVPEGLVVAPCASATPDVAKTIVLTTAAAVKNRFIISSN